MEAIGFRWRGFRSLVDTGEIGLRPLTLVLGPNNSGKSSLLKPLLILKQTMSSPSDSALLLRGPLVDVGTFSEVTYQGASPPPLTFALRFGPPEPASKPIGQLAPAVLEVQFGREPSDDTGLLISFRIYDGADRLMLSRYRTEGGEYSVNQYGRALHLHEEHRALFDAIRTLRPTKFLFDPAEVLAARFTTDDPVPSGPLPRDVVTMIQAMSYTNVRVAALLEEVSYIGPLREPFDRIYLRAGHTPGSVGVGGADAPQIVIARRNDESFRAQVDAHLARFGFKGGLQVDDSARAIDVFRLTAKSTPGAPAVNIADCGFGLSQVLPFIVHAVSAPEDSLLVAEQPEIHLNPRLQIELARLLAWMVEKRSLRILVETHSEHLLNELRIRIAKKRLRASRLQVLFVEKADLRSDVRSVEVAPNGAIDSNAWPKGFFEESMGQALDLLSHAG